MLTTLVPDGNIPAIRHDWSVDEIESIYTAPLLDLVFRAQTVHRAHHAPNQVQGCVLLNIKSGGCPEDCAYCPQSAHYKTGVGRNELVSVDDALDGGARARASRAPRGSAWARRGAMCRTATSSTACSTWCAASGRSAWRPAARSACSTQEQADALAAAGLTAYNHNLDTSPEFYGSIITTRDVRRSARHACARAPGRHHGLLRRHHRHGRRRAARATACCSSSPSLDPHPESVPINLLVRVEGTPLAIVPPEDPLELVRTIATARILMPAVLRAAERRAGCRSPTKRRRSASSPAPTRCSSAIGC